MEFKFGVRAHDLAEKKTPEELASIVSSYGFHYLQLVFAKALDNPSYDSIYVSRVTKALKDKDIAVAMLGAYFNPVHSSSLKVAEGIKTFENNLMIASAFGNPPVGSETGSFNDSPWIYVPKNRTEEGFLQSEKVFKGLTKKAEEVGANISIEPAYGHVMYSVSCLKRLVSDLSSPNVFVTIDLYNLLDVSNFEKRDAIFHEALSSFGAKIKIIHLKDAKVLNEKLIQLAPGEGDFHYQFMLGEIKRYCPNATLVFEGVKSDKIKDAYSYLVSLANNI